MSFNQEESLPALKEITPIKTVASVNPMDESLSNESRKSSRRSKRSNTSSLREQVEYQGKQLESINQRMDILIQKLTDLGGSREVNETLRPEMGNRTMLGLNSAFNSDISDPKISVSQAKEVIEKDKEQKQIEKLAKMKSDRRKSVIQKDENLREEQIASRVSANMLTLQTSSRYGSEKEHLKLSDGRNLKELGSIIEWFKVKDCVTNFRLEHPGIRVIVLNIVNEVNSAHVQILEELSAEITKLEEYQYEGKYLVPNKIVPLMKLMY